MRWRPRVRATPSKFCRPETACHRIYERRETVCRLVYQKRLELWYDFTMIPIFFVRRRGRLPEREK